MAVPRKKNMSNDDRKCVIPPFFLENAINKFDESRTCVIPSTLALQENLTLQQHGRQIPRIWTESSTVLSNASPIESSMVLPKIMCCPTWSPNVVRPHLQWYQGIELPTPLVRTAMLWPPDTSNLMDLMALSKCATKSKVSTRTFVRCFLAEAQTWWAGSLAQQNLARRIFCHALPPPCTTSGSRHIAMVSTNAKTLPSGSGDGGNLVTWRSW